MVPYLTAVIIYPEEIEFPKKAIVRQHGKGVLYDGEGDEGVAYISKLLLETVFSSESGTYLNNHMEVFATERDLSSYIRKHKEYELVSKGWVWYALQVKQDTNFELGSFN